MGLVTGSQWAERCGYEVACRQFGEYSAPDTSLIQERRITAGCGTTPQTILGELPLLWPRSGRFLLPFAPPLYQSPSRFVPWPSRITENKVFSDSKENRNFLPKGLRRGIYGDENVTAFFATDFSP